MDEGDIAHSASGNYCIAIFKEPESYGAMKQCLQDIAHDVSQHKKITVCEQTFDIEYYMGGDWKFLAMITGIDSASSTCACIWCKCPAIDRYDTTMSWSILDKKQGARTIEENKAIAQSRTKRFNVTNEPIFDTIPLTRVVVDNLHLFLRVADVLIDLLLLELKRLDKIEKATKVKGIDQLQYIKKYERTLASIGISGFSFWIGRESKKLKCRTLTGPEKLILFQKLNIVTTFPEIPDCEEVQALWRDLVRVNSLLSVRQKDITAYHVEQFESQSKAFVLKFTELYPSKHVTPYMHCMMMHVSQFMRIHGAILAFTQQGLEKFNDLMTKDYFRSSSHRGLECLTQILQKQNRLEHLEDIGAKRQKRFKVTCSNCKQAGHNILTCSNACMQCGHSPYSTHLVTINGQNIPQCHSLC